MRYAARHDARAVAQTSRWLVSSREFTNFTYDLTPRNLEHLAWFVAEVTGCKAGEARGFMRELLDDGDLRRVLTTHDGRLSGVDADVRYARRVGWYAIVRATRPRLVVETGVDKGLGSMVLAAAVRRNGEGRVIVVDIDPNAGRLIRPPYADVIDLRISDSLAVIPTLADVDLFIHDSDHSAEHEARELVAIEDRLAPGALVLSDNAHATDELARFAERTGRRFLFFDERPAGHWYTGAGIGAAQLPR